MWQAPERPYARRMSRVRVFMACSLDGFIAGPDDELDWLPSQGLEDTYTPFLAQIGALLMGRRTFEVVRGLGGPWPYGDTPVLVATRRPLPPELETEVPSVRGATGRIEELVAQAKGAAKGRDVYLDGGALIRSALDAQLVDELTVSITPTILGEGRPLFAGVSRRHGLELESARPIGAGVVQLRYRLDRAA